MHRNSQKRIIEEGAIYFVTTTTDQRYPFFENDLLCWLFIAELKFTRLLKRFDLYAFCILHDHVHMIIKPSSHIENISRIMQFLKRHFSRNANLIINPSREGDIGQCRLPRREHSRMKDISQKMDEYVNKLSIIHNKLPIEEKMGPRSFKWQKSFHDHIIRSTKDFSNHIDYTRENYKKHYLSDKQSNYPFDYKFTSDNFPNLVDDYSI
jgi:REP element-mobilizing transposase RayT